MLDQASDTPVQPAIPSTLPVKLWTPGLIAGLSFFLGFPAGIVIASINWMRMKMNNKALIHLAVGAFGTFIFVIAIIFVSGTAGRVMSLMANIGVLFYLQQQMKKDIEGFKATGINVENANQLGGCLIGLGILALFLFSIFALAFALTLIGVPIPE